MARHIWILIFVRILKDLFKLIFLQSWQYLESPFRFFFKITAIGHMMVSPGMVTLNIYDGYVFSVFWNDAPKKKQKRKFKKSHTENTE